MKARRSIRLPSYDYSSSGAYFVTICVHNRVCLFGNVHDGVMALNDAGRMMRKWWLELANKFNNVLCDEFVIMPNHVHGIILINTISQKSVGADRCLRPELDDVPQQGRHTGLPLAENKQIRASLSALVQWFKTMSTNEYIRGVKNDSWSRFNTRLWQRNYWEHVIRNEHALRQIREYVQNNPLNWQIDQLNPYVSQKNSVPEFEYGR